MDETVLACPHCNRTGKYYRRQEGSYNRHAGDPDKEFHCTNCLRSFDEPEAREPLPVGPDGDDRVSRTYFTRDQLDRINAALAEADP